MPPITALLHVKDDALRLGRALETLLPCDEIVVVDHHSTDSSPGVAREYGAVIVPERNGAAPDHYLQFPRHEWIFCIEPRESITEALSATLFEWKAQTSAGDAPAYSFYLREETAKGWFQSSSPQIRLVSRTWKHWQGHLPAQNAALPALEGHLLRFSWP